MKTILLIGSMLCLFFLPKPNDGNGKIEHWKAVESRFVKPRNVDVWLPDSYEKNPTKRYAVLYMQDGQMLFDSTTTWNKQAWNVAETLTKLQKTGKIRDCIVVGIWNTDLRGAEYLPQKPFQNLPKARQDTLRNRFKTEVQSDNYLRFVVQELKPLMDKTYRTRAERSQTFVAGSSMGGLISLYALCEYPSVFGGAACLSTHWLGAGYENTPDFRNAYLAYLDKKLPSPKDTKIYFDFGTLTLDAFYEPHQTVVDSFMRAKGFSEKNWITRKFDGENHSEKSWQKRFDIPAAFLLKKNN